MEAILEYEVAVQKLCDFCDIEAGLRVEIKTNDYPMQIEFAPDPQLKVYSPSNVDDEDGNMTIVLDLTTEIRSTLKIDISANVLKKIISLSEKVGNYYYRAFRENAGYLGETNDD